MDREVGGGREAALTGKAAVSGVMSIREPQDRVCFRKECEEVAVCVQSGWEPGRHGEVFKGINTKRFPSISG